MKRYIDSAILSAVLIITALWGYLSSSTASLTALIPVVIGLGILACVPAIKKGSKVAKIIGTVLTVAVVIGLIKPLMGALDRDDMCALFRVLLMLIVGLYALLSSAFCPRCK